MCKHKNSEFVHNYKEDAREFGFDHPERSVWKCLECNEYFGRTTLVDGGYTVQVAPPNDAVGLL